MEHALGNSAIYHLVSAVYYDNEPATQPYLPATFTQEGFIHCTADLTILLQVANAYFADLSEPLLVLVIDPWQLTAPLKFEPPAPPPTMTTTPTYTTEAETELLFPHIYGPLNRSAIVDNFALSRDASGRWRLPHSEA